ncbi:hypothetical protein HO839_09690 [Streptococcus suis]|nr:hypothetical protein [Streptococcus suis]
MMHKFTVEIIFGELAFHLSLGIMFSVAVIQCLICFFLAKESSSELQEELRHVQAFVSSIDKNRSLSSLTKISYGLMLVSLLVQSIVPALFLFFLLVVKYLVDLYARVKLVELFRGGLLLKYLAGLIFVEQLVYSLVLSAMDGISCDSVCRGSSFFKFPNSLFKTEGIQVK